MMIEEFLAKFHDHGDILEAGLMNISVAFRIQGFDATNRGDESAAIQTGMGTRRATQVCRGSGLQAVGQLLPLLGAYVISRRRRR